MKQLLITVVLLLPLVLFGQSKLVFEIGQKEKNINTKIPFDKPLQDWWDANQGADEQATLEKMETYFQQNFILYGTNGQPLVLENIGISDVNPDDNYPDKVELIFKGKNIARVENRCFENIEGHENHHSFIDKEGNAGKQFITTSKKPIYIFPLKAAGARLFPTNHPFWIFLGIAACVAVVFLAKRISKT